MGMFLNNMLYKAHENIITFVFRTVTFFNRKFKACGHAKFSSKIVHCLAWHPESTATDITYSPLRNYLAVAFECCTILIFDLSNFVDYFAKLEDSINDDNLKEKCDIYKVHELITTLTGHVQNVVCLAWSPYMSGYLISGSYDRTAQVLEIHNKTIFPKNNLFTY